MLSIWEVTDCPVAFWLRLTLLLFRVKQFCWNLEILKKATLNFSDDFWHCFFFFLGIVYSCMLLSKCSWPTFSTQYFLRNVTVTMLYRFYSTDNYSGHSDRFPWWPPKKKVKNKNQRLEGIKKNKLFSVYSFLKIQYYEKNILWRKLVFFSFILYSQFNTTVELLHM